MLTRYSKLLRLLLPVMLLAGCGNPATSQSEFCQVTPGAIYLNDTETLTDANARKLKVYDLYGIQHCGWKY